MASEEPREGRMASRWVWKATERGEGREERNPAREEGREERGRAHGKASSCGV